MYLIGINFCRDKFLRMVFDCFLRVFIFASIYFCELNISKGNAGIFFCEFHIFKKSVDLIDINFFYLLKK